MVLNGFVRDQNAFVEIDRISSRQYLMQESICAQETKLMQNFGVTNKECYGNGIFYSSHLRMSGVLNLSYWMSVRHAARSYRGSLAHDRFPQTKNVQKIFSQTNPSKYP